MAIKSSKKKKKIRREEDAPAEGMYAGLRMETLDSESDACFNALVYGMTGVGKTRLLGSAQKCIDTSPIFYIAIDPGTLSINGSGIEVFRPQNFKEIQQAYDFLRFENTRFKSVGIDSLTEMHDKLSMGDILGVLQEDSSYSNLAGHVPANQYDWLSSGEQMRRTIRAFRDLAYLPDEERRIHVLMTALEKTDEKRSVVCPSLPGALALGVGASVDILARLSVEKLEVAEGRFKPTRHLSLAETESEEGLRYMAKARTPVNIKFPKEVWKPTMTNLLAFWKGETSSSRDSDD